MDAKEEQSHHGDEVIRSLCYKIKKRTTSEGREQRKEREADGITSRLYM